MKPLRIGLDLDGTIINHHPNKLALAADYGVALEPWQANPNVLRDFFPREQAEDFHNKIYAYMTLTAPAIAGALERIAQLPGEIYIVSARRPASAPFADMWLANNRVHELIPKNRIHFVGNAQEKRPVVERLGIDVFLDDELRVLGLLPEGVRKVFLDADNLRNRLNPEPHIHVVGDWEGFFRLI